MRNKLQARLARLEAHSSVRMAPLFRYGWLKPLPDDYSGERHVVTVRREPTASPNIEWCEFEERPGPESVVDADRGLTVYLTM